MRLCLSVKIQLLADQFWTLSSVASCIPRIVSLVSTFRTAIIRSTCMHGSNCVELHNPGHSHKYACHAYSGRLKRSVAWTTSRYRVCRLLAQYVRRQMSVKSKSADANTVANASYTESDKKKWRVLCNVDLIAETHLWATFCDEYDDMKDAAFEDWIKSKNLDDDQERNARKERDKAREKSTEAARKRRSKQYAKECEYENNKKRSKPVLAPQSKCRPRDKTKNTSRPASTPAPMVWKHLDASKVPTPPAAPPPKQVIAGHKEAIEYKKQQLIDELRAVMYANPIGRGKRSRGYSSSSSSKAKPQYPWTSATRTNSASSQDTYWNSDDDEVAR